MQHCRLLRLHLLSISSHTISPRFKSEGCEAMACVFFFTCFDCLPIYIVSLLSSASVFLQLTIMSTTYSTVSPVHGCPKNVSKDEGTWFVPAEPLYRQMLCRSSTKVGPAAGTVCNNTQASITSTAGGQVWILLL